MTSCLTHPTSCALGLTGSKCKRLVRSSAHAHAFTRSRTTPTTRCSAAAGEAGEGPRGSAGADGEGAGAGGDDAAAARAAAADAAKQRTGLETAMAAAVVGPARGGLHHTSVSLCLSV